MRPLILISNDDGYHAKGIKMLTDMVKGIGDIIVCAPDSARSGFSRAFSMSPLSFKKYSHEDYEDTTIDIYRCSGTPVDCVKMAYSQVCPRKPSLVLGGINHGDNASTNSQYSGTVGIVIEGALKKIPSVAFSLCEYGDDLDFEPIRPLVQKIVKKVLAEGLPEYACLNVNVPTDWNGETKLCRMAHGHWRNEVEKRERPGSGTPYYWMTGYYQNDEPNAEDTDAWAIAHGYAAITPLTADHTCRDITKFEI